MKRLYGFRRYDSILLRANTKRITSLPMPRPRRQQFVLKSISFKLSDKARFALRVIARRQNKTDALVLEEAIEDIANRLPLSRHWLELWDEEEAVRMLNLFALAEYKAATGEAARVAFVAAHAQFFYADKARQTPHRARATILWPHIDEMETLWTKKKSEDYWAAAKAMASLLRKAKLDPPPFG